ncbi:MAG: hypothetical protein FJ263_05650 [Planctomycetes bacterium]|nr:hypothetical protein [Planctomycetota bacterium]
MRFQNKADYWLWLVAVALAGWVIPGGGHFLIRQPKRGMIIFITITLTFGLGLYLGSIGIIDSVGGWAWYIAQMMATPAVWILDHLARHGAYQSYGRPCDLGQIYTAVAGLLNLLAVFSAVYMAYAGRGEFIGREE